MQITDEIRRRGYIFLPGYMQGRSTEEVVRRAGRKSDAPVHRLKPSTVESSTPNTYTGMFGHGRFPFHTDLAHWRHPPRFLLLRCVSGFDEVPTLLIDSASLIEIVGRNVLGRSLVRPRRPIAGVLPLLRLFDPHRGDNGLFRWDEIFVRPASPAGEIGVRQLTEALTVVAPISISLAMPGDTLVVDNWRMVHAREAVPPDCRGRVLERAYLEWLF